MIIARDHIANCSNCGQPNRQDEMTLVADNKEGEHARYLCNECIVQFEDGTKAEMKDGLIRGNLAMAIVGFGLLFFAGCAFALMILS